MWVGASLITRLIDRFPILIWFGGGLLGWVAGEMIATDRLVQEHMVALMPPTLQGLVPHAIGVLGATLVIAIGLRLKRRSDRAVAQQQAAAVGRAEADMLGT